MSARALGFLVVALGLVALGLGWLSRLDSGGVLGPRKVNKRWR